MASWRRLQRQNPNEVLSLLFGATSYKRRGNAKMETPKKEG
jgi:hypothetical protein